MKKYKNFSKATYVIDSKSKLYYKINILFICLFHSLLRFSALRATPEVLTNYIIAV